MNFNLPILEVPHPTQEFPLVLFAGDNYNNGSEGYIHRSRPNEYRVWARTVQNSLQEFVFRSPLVLPGWKLTFQACCAAGNSWTASMSNASNISSLHFYMFDNLPIGEGIFYTQWLHWIQEFSVKVLQNLNKHCQPLKKVRIIVDACEVIFRHEAGLVRGRHNSKNGFRFQTPFTRVPRFENGANKSQKAFALTWYIYTSLKLCENISYVYLTEAIWEQFLNGARWKRNPLAVLCEHKIQYFSLCFSSQPPLSQNNSLNHFLCNFLNALFEKFKV